MLRALSSNNAIRDIAYVLVTNLIRTVPWEGRTAVYVATATAL
jgi:hypothetical protein